MKLTEQMQKVIRVVGKGGAVVHLTTCSADGVPNIVAERFVACYRDSYIIIADMFAQKTKVNLNENEIACISVANPVKDHTWVFRGPCTDISLAAPENETWYGVRAGDLIAEWGDWANKEPPDEVPPDIEPPALAQRGIICMKGEECYSYAAADAGRAIL